MFISTTTLHLLLPLMAGGFFLFRSSCRCRELNNSPGNRLIRLPPTLWCTLRAQRGGNSAADNEVRPRKLRGGSLRVEVSRYTYIHILYIQCYDCRVMILVADYFGLLRTKWVVNQS